MAKDYQIGDTVRVRLYSGEVVQGKITANFMSSSGRKLQIVFGTRVAQVNLDQVLPDDSK